MRMIGSIPDAEQAQRFEDYLVAQGIQATLEQSARGMDVWVHHDDQVDPARQEIDRFLANPADARYDAHAGAAERIRAEEENRQTRLRKKYVDVRTHWARPAIGPRPVTFVLIALSVVVAMGSGAGRDFQAVDMIRITSAQVTQNTVEWEAGLPEIRHGQVWRLVTPIFIHFGFIHLLFNMMWLYQLGSLIEVRKGSLALLAIVLVAAIPSNFLQYWDSGPLFGGMSGVVYALFGYVWMKGRFEPYQGMAIHSDAVFIMLAWLVLCFTGFLGPIANTAHVVGLIVGVVIGAGPHFWRKYIRKRA